MFINRKIVFIFTAICILFTYCASSQSNQNMKIKTVTTLDINQYAGKWYEIARKPFRYEKDLVNTTATYTLRDDGKITVLNEGYKHTPDGKHKKAEGVAWRPNPEHPGRLKVRFFWPFKSDYFVIALDTTSYQYALVTTKSKDLLWFLSRTPDMDEQLFNQLKTIATENGIDLNDLIVVKQKWK